MREALAGAEYLPVSGTGFLANHSVEIRVADDTLHDNRFETDASGQPIESDSNGKLTNVKINVPCSPQAVRHFSATDGRHVPDSQDHTGVLNSNTVTLHCP